MENLNERIKCLRKDRGWTQLQLAEKLNVTDKAVSKWEVGDANPDLSIIIAMASLFGVSIDYLVSGKVDEEKITLDDMDSKKREEYLIKKDDEINFKKYGYTNPYIIMRDNYGRQTDEQKNILDLIYKHNSKKIFSLLIESTLSKFATNQRKSNIPCCFSANQINGDLDKYIKMCCSIGCVGGLELIDLKFFSIGDQTSEKLVKVYIKPGNFGDDECFAARTLALSTLEYALDLKTSSESIINYFCDVEFFKEKKNRVYLMVDDLATCLYNNKDEDRLNKLITSLNQNNEYGNSIYSESTYGSWYTGKSISADGGIYFHNNTGSSLSYLRAYVYPLNKALNKAVEAKDYKWIKIFNDYNSRLCKLIPGLKIKEYSNHEISVMKVEFDPKSSREEIWNEKYITNGVLDMAKFLSQEVRYNKASLDSLKTAKDFVNDDILNYVLKHPIHKYEQIISLLNNNDLKSLYRLAIDVGDAQLESAVLEGNKDKIIEIAEKQKSFRGIHNELTGFEAISLKFFESYKKDAIKAIIHQIEELIEAITMDKKCKAELERVNREITFDYLRSELAKGNIDNTIIKLCVKLEAILKYGYRYEGDLFEMVDQYIKNHFTIHELHNCWDDEDNNYYYYKEEDERFTEENKQNEIKTTVLHKLRKKRNSIVHAEKYSSDMSVEEIELCIGIVESMQEVC